MLECITGELDANVLSDMIIDTEFCKEVLKENNDDLGIDAYYIDRDKQIVMLFNFKYRDNFKETSSLHESDALDSVKFFSILESENTSPIKKSIRTKKAIEEINECLNSADDFSTVLYMVANVNGEISKSPSLEAFKKQYSLKIKEVLLDNISSYISDVPLKKKATLYINKGAYLKYGNDSKPSNNSYLVRISLADLVRITCSNRTLRENPSMPDSVVLEKESLDLDLLYENVRGYLGDTDYNKNIVQTINNEPSCFFAYNNGITIVTSDLNFDLVNVKKDKLTMNGFQIVNGGQTLRSIYSFCNTSFDSKKLLDSEVLLRILKVNNEKMKSHIAEYTNSQNAITYSDLKSVALLQRQLEAYLKQKSINYLRKAGDYKHIEATDYTISMIKTAQIIYSYIGNPHKAGNQRRKLFKNHYSEIFPDDLDLEYVERLIRLYFRITNLYEKTIYKTYDQKVFYILYILHYIKRKKISDKYIRELIDFLEETIKKYDPKSKLSEARKILKVDFKEKLDESLKIKLGKSALVTNK